MCRLIVQALETDKTVESIPHHDRPNETYVALRVAGEGLLRITEQTDWFTVRTGNLYWFNEGMGQGRLPGEWSMVPPFLCVCMCTAYTWKG